MFARRIERGSPNQIWIVVQNVSTSTLGVGRGVVWYTADSEGTQVTWPTTNLSVRGLLAGVVGYRPIQPGEWGTLLVHGEHDSIAFWAKNIFIGRLQWHSMASRMLCFADTGWTTWTTLVGCFSTLSWRATYTTYTSSVHEFMHAACPGVWILTSLFNKETTGSNFGYSKGFVKVL